MRLTPSGPVYSWARSQMAWFVSRTMTSSRFHVASCLGRSGWIFIALQVLDLTTFYGERASGSSRWRCVDHVVGRGDHGRKATRAPEVVANGAKRL